MNAEISAYNTLLSAQDQELCDFLAQQIDRELPMAESKIWHRHHWIDNENIGHRVTGSITLIL
jgi:hypothetical protein